MTPVLTDPRLIVGLDLPSLEAALAMVKRLGPTISAYKIGLTLLARPGGVTFAHELRAAGKSVFQDWKLHDIGATVEKATAALAATGACDFLTVHAEPQVMRGAVKGRDAAGTGTKLLAVTVLTSLDEAQLRETGVAGPVLDHVVHLARLAQDCGLDGVVASPREITAIRTACGPRFLIVTPGIRPATGALVNDDQSRTMTPAGAVAAGASYLVIGRPITTAADPRAAAAHIAAHL